MIPTTKLSHVAGIKPQDENHTWLGKVNQVND